MNKYPATDYRGHAIREGDTIIHPDGTTGVVVRITRPEDSKIAPEDWSFQDEWRVDYGDEGRPYRLALQIGDRGMAVVWDAMTVFDALESIANVLPPYFHARLHGGRLKLGKFEVAIIPSFLREVGYVCFSTQLTKGQVEGRLLTETRRVLETLKQHELNAYQTSWDKCFLDWLEIRLPDDRAHLLEYDKGALFNVFKAVGGYFDTDGKVYFPDTLDIDALSLFGSISNSP